MKLANKVLGHGELAGSVVGGAWHGTVSVESRFDWPKLPPMDYVRAFAAQELAKAWWLDSGACFEETVRLRVTDWTGMTETFDVGIAIRLEARAKVVPA